MKIEATLHPLQFDQSHSGRRTDGGYAGGILGTCVEFGKFDKYEAILDDRQSFDILAAPCIIHFVDDKSLKCTVEIGDETMFMLNRYGKHSYNELVRLRLLSFLRSLAIPSPPTGLATTINTYKYC